MTVDRIERDILIEAPVHVVWGVVTEPEQISQWFTDTAEVDVRPGGEGTLMWEMKATGEPATAHLTVQSVERPHLFSFRWDYAEGAAPREGNSLLVEFTLAEEGENTRLRVVESGFVAFDRPEEDKAAYIEDHTHGWETHLGSLRNYMARKVQAPSTR